MPVGLLRIALAQCSAIPGDVSINADAAARVVARAADQGAHLVVFPELSLTGYELTFIRRNPEAWLRAEDERLDPVRRVCTEARVTAVVGAPLRSIHDKPYIASIVVGPQERVFVSCKQHVHDSELEIFEPGEPAEPFEVAGWRVALAVCFDVARPRHAEAAAAHGADLYAVSALYIVGEERRADLHFGARAMDYRMFSCLANYAGITGGHVSSGGSGVWLPTGEPLVRSASSDQELVVADLDPGSLAPFRR
jgi:5-aminopentanamidase